MLCLTITLEKKLAKCTKASIKSLIFDVLFNLITAASETTTQKKKMRNINFVVSGSQTIKNFIRFVEFKFGKVSHCVRARKKFYLLVILNK